mmetsp:Transcript_21895/g.40842  ORF Transcript_21895/g.40842 Transcript_21895/m.40842 type:complete len:101 (+) Transcript_21895:629-931(+)
MEIRYLLRCLVHPHKFCWEVDRAEGAALERQAAAVTAADAHLAKGNGLAPPPRMVLHMLLSGGECLDLMTDQALVRRYLCVIRVDIKGARELERGWLQSI